MRKYFLKYYYLIVNISLLGGVRDNWNYILFDIYLCKNFKFILGLDIFINNIFIEF